ncbi:MAG: hypothetical protein ABII90_03525 [Bacteroidota bacterium]
MKPATTKSFGIIGLMILFACEKDITIKPQAYESKPSIQCLLTPNTIPKLYLFKTIPYFDTQQSYNDLFIRDANVIITSSLGSDVLFPDSTLNEFYCKYDYFYKGSQLTQKNITYHLKIEYAGKTYSANTSTNQSVVQLDSVTYIEQFQDIYGEHEGIVSHFTDDPSMDNYYRFEMHRMVDSSTTDVNDFHSCSGAEFVSITEIGRTIYSAVNQNGLPMSYVIEPAYKHNEDDVAYIFLQSCDENMFEFYDKLDKQRLAQANPFAEPVFINSSQFADAVGVFGSYALSDSVNFIFPE